MDYTEVLFEEQNHLGIITLNRPAALNSLNHSMIHAIYNQLKSWEFVDNIKAVLIRAVPGRAFCAGGDLRLTYDRIKAKDPIMADFFRDEYQLNRKIFHYPKPYIALLDGITMGGGVGISLHGSHRIATDKLLFAMPETGIGFFPDVGGTYFLPRLPGRIGYYLGLTGARVVSDECVKLGLADVKISQDAITDLTNELMQESFTGDAHAVVSKIIEQYRLPVHASPLLEQQQAIDHCFAGSTMEEIVAALKNSTNPLCSDAAIALAQKSPTSLKITLRALQQGKHSDFDECMRQEFRLVSRFLLGHDFAEGIRAVIIDKDQKPQWKPAVIEDVKEAEVDKYFEPLCDEV